MSSYAGTADRTDRTKAIVAVVAVHAMLATIILTGLKVGEISRTIESMTTIDVREPPRPPVSPPKPAPKPQQMRKEAGPPAPKAEPTPLVAPPPKISVPTPLPAAKVAGTGSAPNSGASSAGDGTGAGGSGNGPGGGGSADYSRFTPARLVRNLSRGDYRFIAGGRLPRGIAMVHLVVQPNGVPGNCRLVRSSGDPSVDAALCPLITDRLRFRPALDDQGRPIPYQLDYVATWTL